MQVRFFWLKILRIVISQANIEPTSSSLAYIDTKNTNIRFYSYFFQFCYAPSSINVLKTYIDQEKKNSTQHKHTSSLFQLQTKPE